MHTSDNKLNVINVQEKHVIGTWLSQPRSCHVLGVIVTCDLACRTGVYFCHFCGAREAGERERERGRSASRAKAKSKSNLYMIEGKWDSSVMFLKLTFRRSHPFCRKLFANYWHTLEQSDAEKESAFYFLIEKQSKTTVRLEQRVSEISGRSKSVLYALIMRLRILRCICSTY